MKFSKRMERLGHGRGRGRGRHAPSQSPTFIMARGRGRGRGLISPNSPQIGQQQNGQLNAHGRQQNREINAHGQQQNREINAESSLGQQQYGDLHPSMFPPSLGVSIVPDPIGNLPVSESDLRALMDDMYHPDPELEAPVGETDASFVFRAMERSNGQGRSRGRGRGRGRPRGQNGTRGRGRGHGSRLEPRTRGRGRGRGRAKSGGGRGRGRARGGSRRRRESGSASDTPSEMEFNDYEPPWDLEGEEGGEGPLNLIPDDYDPPVESDHDDPDYDPQNDEGYVPPQDLEDDVHNELVLDQPDLHLGANQPPTNQANSQPTNQANQPPPPPTNQMSPPSNQANSQPTNQANQQTPTQANPPSPNQANPPPTNQANPPPTNQTNSAPTNQANPPPSNQANPPLPNQANPPPDPPVTYTPPPLFYKQEGHRSHVVITGKNPAALTVRKHCVKQFTIYEKYTDYLIDAGFYNVCRIGHICADKYLITALVERWRPETHTFHLPVGEMMVTLQDVAVLLGLRIDGDPVVPERRRRSTEEWHAMIRTYLGVEVEEDTFRAGSQTALSIKWLKSKFAKLEREVGETNEQFEYKTQCHVRGVILMTLGYLLFTDLSGDSISINYLPFLTDLSQVGRYSWGSATLAYLNRELCRACKEGTKQMGGPVLLLQLWAWERFLFGRPKTRRGEVPPRLGGFNYRPELRFPYGHKWSGYHDWSGVNLARVLDYYRDELDYLREYQVNWDPYSQEDLALLPPICTEAQHLWNYSGPIHHFWMVEPHNTRRVQRQFGKYQNFPPNRCDLDDFACRNKNPGAGHDWEALHERYLEQWANRANSVFLEERPYDMDTYDDYMSWFSENSRLYLQPLVSKIKRGEQRGPLRELLYQIRASITHETATKVKELGAKCKKKIEEGAEGELKEFSLEMLRGIRGLLIVINQFIPSDPIFAPIYDVQNQEPQGEGNGDLPGGDHGDQPGGGSGDLPGGGSGERTGGGSGEETGGSGRARKRARVRGG